MADIGLRTNIAVGEQIATAYDIALGNSNFQGGEKTGTFTCVSVQVIWSGAIGVLDGDLKLQESNDGTNWVDSSINTAINAATGNVMLKDASFAADKIRAVLTVNGLTGGTLDLHLVAKD